MSQSQISSFGSRRVERLLQNSVKSCPGASKPGMEFSYHEKVLVDLMNLEFCNFASLVDEMSNKVVILCPW